MRTLILLFVVGIVGSAATTILTAYMKSDSNEEAFADFARVQNANPGTFLPYVAQSITACGSDIPAETPNFGRYTKTVSVMLGHISELRATRNDPAAQKKQKTALAKQMATNLKDTSDEDFKVLTAEILALSKDRQKQGCIARNSVAKFTRS
ncbi:MAG: hypothetical protein BGN87_16900 [Rhizobiales bacterium 65-79]|jgi:hypothetical protein|nr:hypothetical protein [Hyphomicrobiales bacterium]OJU06650.1 MAG: hypothetical protein BGN87_16900 [Rhizobiales bacterium 65-79]